jgi:hypothetical protein
MPVNLCALEGPQAFSFDGGSEAPGSHIPHRPDVSELLQEVFRCWKDCMGLISMSGPALIM